MTITDRDLRILEWVHECRFLTRRHVERLEFGGKASSRAKLRLSLLYHNGYLGRLPLPLRDAYGASLAVYYLDRAGARLLAAAQRRAPAELAWRGRDAQGEELFLRHTLAVASVRVAFAVASRRHGLELHWLDESTLRRLDVRERVRSGRGGEVSLLPDGYFTISGDGWADGFALEVDRGTVPERRMRARIAAYGQWASSGAYRGRLPVASLRVIFGVLGGQRDRQRLERLKRWCEEEGGRSLFWFIDGAGLDRDVLADPVWQVAGASGLRPLPLGRD